MYFSLIFITSRYFRTIFPKLDYCKGEEYHLIRAEVKEMHSASQVTICAPLGFPRIAKVGTPAAETSESFLSENINICVVGFFFPPLEGKKAERKNVIIYGKEKSLQ